MRALLIIGSLLIGFALSYGMLQLIAPRAPQPERASQEARALINDASLGRGAAACQRMLPSARQQTLALARARRVRASSCAQAWNRMIRGLLLKGAPGESPTVSGFGVEQGVALREVRVGSSSLRMRLRARDGEFRLQALSLSG